MTLVDLEAKLIRITGERERAYVETVAEADGIIFLCPTCYESNGGPKGTHSIICWRPHVPKSVKPGPGRWELIGNTVDDVTLIAGSSSIQIQGGCNAHFFVKEGSIA